MTPEIQHPGLRRQRSSVRDFKFGVSKTALWVGYFRVVESRRKDSLLVDSLAKDLVGDDVAQECWRRMVDAVWVPSFIMSKEKYGQMEHDHFVVRHRYIDDFALRHLAEHVRMAERAGAYPQQLQVVNMACGLDSRAFRLCFPTNTTLWEVDRQEMVSYKNEQLADMVPPPKPRCKRVTVAADLLQDNWEALLLGTGFDPSLPTVWLAEGLLMYLAEPEIRALMTRIKAMSAPGSALVADMVNKAFMLYPFQRQRLAVLGHDGCPFRSSSLAPARFLNSAGLHDSRYVFQGDADASYGRVRPYVLFPILRVTLRGGLACAAASALHVLAGLPLLAAGLLALALVEAISMAGALEDLVRWLVMAFYPTSYIVEGMLERAPGQASPSPTKALKQQ